MKEQELFTIATSRPQATSKQQETKRPGNFIPLLPCVILTVIITGCLFADLLCERDPSYLDLANTLVPPGKSFYFGTDALGRDLFAAIWYGGRISLSIGILSAAISTIIALLYGSLCAFVPPLLDGILLRLTDLMLSIPNLILIIFVQSALGEANILSLSLVIGFTSWFGMARIVRTEVKKIKHNDYVIAARAMGGSFIYLLFRHLIPNVIPSILFMMIMTVRSAIAAESTLSFLGIGLPIETISWGSLLSLSEQALLGRGWWIMVIPGIFLLLTLLSITEMGEYLRIRLNSGKKQIR